MKWIEWQTRTGEAITAGGRTITPQSQALVIRFPFGGFVWNRPTAVLVQQGEQTEQIPIPDITRLSQLALLIATISLTLILWLTNRSVKREM
jgi:hypothetical protein